MTKTAGSTGNCPFSPLPPNSERELGRGGNGGIDCLIFYSKLGTVPGNVVLSIINVISSDKTGLVPYSKITWIVFSVM